jgi:hypothetical protein
MFSACVIKDAALSLTMVKALAEKGVNPNQTDLLN